MRPYNKGPSIWGLYWTDFWKLLNLRGPVSPWVFSAREASVCHSMRAGDPACPFSAMPLKCSIILYGTILHYVK